MNHNCVILDAAKVEFGDNVFIGPNCGFYTAGHPLNVLDRNKGLEYAKPIKVGNNVWFGGNVIVLPGITIGDKVFTGTHGFAGEFSYLSDDWTKINGFDGKWGSDSSALRLVKMIGQAVGKEGIEGPEAFEYCNQGNEKALAALKEFCGTLAMGLFNIQAAVDPEKIAIGGGISQQPILHEYIQKSLDEIYEKMPIPIPRVQIVPCAYFNDSNLIGALANYKKTFNIE